MQEMKLKAKRVKFFVDKKKTKAKSELDVFNAVSSRVLIDRVLENLSKVQKDCKKQVPFYLPKSTYENLQVALAYSFSKTMSKDTRKVKEMIAILNQNREELPLNQIALLVDTFIEFLYQGRENYEDFDDVLYLVSNLFPLLYDERNCNES